MDPHLNEYVSNTAKIRALSSPSIQDIDNAAEYGTLLQDNFITIGQLARENRDILSEHLFPFLEENASVSNAELEGLGRFEDSLLHAQTMENLDPAIHAEISDSLLHKAQSGDSVKLLLKQLDREIMACYTMQNITSRLTSYAQIAETYRQRGMEAGKKIREYLEPEAFAALPDNECRELVLSNARYIWRLYEGVALSPEKNREILSNMESALALAETPYYRKHMPMYDWSYHEFRALQDILKLTEYNNTRRFPQDAIEKICAYGERLDRLWHSAPLFYKDLMHENELQILLLRAGYLNGQVAVEDYRRDLLSLYNSRDRNDYSQAGMTLNLMLPAEYILTLAPDALTEDEKYQVSRFYHDTLNYAFHMSGRDTLSYMLGFLSHLLDCFIEVPGGMTFGEMCLDCLGALHPPTYVHSIMVGQIARCLCRHLMRLHPEYFEVPNPRSGCDTPSSDRSATRISEKSRPETEGFPSLKGLNLKSEEAILGFTYQAAVCHDFGKLLITDTIMVYGRKLLDSEFFLLRTHPKSGADMMLRHESTRPYANIALAHHRWYDDSKGYPEDLKTADLPEKIIIDLVCCADCLDAATDTVGRSYNRGKTMDDFIVELKEGAGTRYAPYLPELFDDATLRRDLRFLLQQGRRSSYSKVYRQLKDLTDQSVLYGENNDYNVLVASTVGGTFRQTFS